MSGNGSTNRWKYRVRKLIFFSILLIPLWSYLIWLSGEDTTLRVVMLDKTAQDFSNIEHRAFTWVLNHNHYVKDDGSNYERRVDYLGYFPSPQNLLKTNDLKGADQETIDSIAKALDVGYFIDTYGSYYEDWLIRKSEIPKRGKIYGGLESEDVSLMTSLINEKKLVIAEFSIFGSPTPRHIKERAENLLNMKFSGWVGRYFEELDTNLNSDIPNWMPENYQQQYHEPYNFKGPGIGFFHDDGNMLILQDEELIHRLPIIETEENLASELGVDPYIRYPFWFEICEPDTAVRVVSQYRIYASTSGASKMKALGIPQSFPAVVSQPDWRVIYLAGDFTDNPINMFSKNFAGVEWVDVLFYDNSNQGDRRKFFWDYYNPFMEGVLERYLDETRNNTPHPIQLPQRSGYALKERMLVNFNAAEVDWTRIANPVIEKGQIIDTIGTIAEHPIAFVHFGSFGRTSDANRFIKSNKISFAISRFNGNTGQYDVVIPCYTESKAREILQVVDSKFPRATIKL